MGVRNTSIQVVFRVQTENRKSELGRSQEADLNENNIRTYRKFTKMEHVKKIGFLAGPTSNLGI